MRKFSLEKQEKIEYEIYKQKENSILILNSKDTSLVEFLIKKDTDYGK